MSGFIARHPVITALLLVAGWVVVSGFANAL